MNKNSSSPSDKFFTLITLPSTPLGLCLSSPHPLKSLGRLSRATLAPCRLCFRIVVRPPSWHFSSLALLLRLRLSVAHFASAISTCTKPHKHALASASTALLSLVRASFAPSPLSYVFASVCTWSPVLVSSCPQLIPPFLRSCVTSPTLQRPFSSLYATRAKTPRCCEHSLLRVHRCTFTSPLVPHNLRYLQLFTPFPHHSPSCSHAVPSPLKPSCLTSLQLPGAIRTSLFTMFTSLHSFPQSGDLSHLRASLQAHGGYPLTSSLCRACPALACSDLFSTSGTLCAVVTAASSHFTSSTCTRAFSLRLPSDLLCPTCSCSYVFRAPLFFTFGCIAAYWCCLLPCSDTLLLRVARFYSPSKGFIPLKTEYRTRHPQHGLFVQTVFSLSPYACGHTWTRSSTVSRRIPRDSRIFLTSP